MTLEPVSRRGLALAAVLATIGLSAFRGARLELGPLLVHPYLVPMFVLFAMAAMSQLRRFPRDVLLASVIFVALYAISALPSSGLVGELLKVVASFVTAITCALCLRGPRDFWAATLGLNVAATIMTIKGFAAGLVAYSGYNPLGEIGNKNAFSLYALPPVLLGGYVILDRRAPRWLRIALLVNACLIAFEIFSGANRSGWLGLLLIAIALAVRGQRVRGTVAMAAIGGLVYVLLTQFGSTEVMDYRIKQTQQGYSSDVRREALFEASLRIGLDNPLLGVSPQRLPEELARATRSLEPAIDPHNVFGHVIGGCGLLAAASFLWLGFVAWRRPRPGAPPGSPARFASQLLQIQIVLFIVRGMFSREILYSPTFAAGFGLCIGLCLVEYGALARARRTVAAPARRPAPTAAAPTHDLAPASP